MGFHVPALHLIRGFLCAHEHRQFILCVPVMDGHGACRRMLEFVYVCVQDRMVKMVVDKDSDVAVEVVNLLLLIQQ